MNLKKKKKNQLIFEHHKKVGLYHWVIFSLFFFNKLGKKMDKNMQTIDSNMELKGHLILLP